MGEIKSTLDLVMERTRNLSMSDDEKARQRQADFEKRLQGLLIRYDESVLTLENLKARIEALKTEHKITDQALVMKAVLGRINPDADNKIWLELVAALSPGTTDPIEEILDDYRQQQKELLKTGEAQMQARLSDEYGIKGSAVIANPLKDEQYLEKLLALQDETRTRIQVLS